MPFIHVRVAAPSFTPLQTERIQNGVTRLMADTLNKKAEVTAVLVEAAPSGWSIGAAQVDVAAHLDATVTAGTNTIAEKSRFIQQAHGLLREVLGEALPVASYVVITEAPGENWGYAGQTQAHRAAQRLRF